MLRKENNYLTVLMFMEPSSEKLEYKHLELEECKTKGVLGVVSIKLILPWDSFRTVQRINEWKIVIYLLILKKMDLKWLTIRRFNGA